MCLQCLTHCRVGHFHPVVPDWPLLCGGNCSPMFACMLRSQLCTLPGMHGIFRQSKPLLTWRLAVQWAASSQFQIDGKTVTLKA